MRGVRSGTDGGQDQRPHAHHLLGVAADPVRVPMFTQAISFAGLAGTAGAVGASKLIKSLLQLADGTSA